MKKKLLNKNLKSVTPYNNDTPKKKQIKDMFNNIASRYDFLNHFLSFGMDYYWRKKAINQIDNSPKKILDVATGTADFAITAAKMKEVQITGIDISKKMIEIGRKKIRKKKLEERINLQIADTEDLPFENDCFDAITAGFGVRNFESLDLGLLEIYRTLKKDGILVILEPSQPSRFPLKQVYNIYFNKLLPLIGRLISKDEKAYHYLPESVSTFPKKKEFMKIIENIGFIKCKHIGLTFGIVDLYIAIK